MLIPISTRFGPNNKGLFSAGGIGEDRGLVEVITQSVFCERGEDDFKVKCTVGEQNFENFVNDTRFAVRRLKDLFRY